MDKQITKGRKMSSFTEIDKYIEEHLGESLDELNRLCAIPSVAAQNLGLDECAELVAGFLDKRGFKTEIMPSGGSPVVFAERKGRSDKTLLFYNHYDVQPPDPIELWDSPPFEATIRNGKLFARGAADNKGNITSRLLAIDALLAVDQELPCNVKFIIEGEEEISSIHLPEFVKANTEKLSADCCIWEFGGVDYRDVPMQYLGLRGICYVELSVEGTKVDVHSGIGGSIFPNAAWRLVWALSTLKGLDERILLPGHYDNVIPPTSRDKELLGNLPEVSNEYKKRFGVNEFLRGTQDELELKTQEIFEPTCTICGLTSGYQGVGSKTVLPAKASAKIDFRLVPDQTPEKVLTSLRTHLDNGGFSDVKMTYLGGEPPGRTDIDDPMVSLIVNAAPDVYGAPMEIVPMVGGSGPNHAFLHYLNLPVLTVGIGYPGGKAHSPNENIRIDLYLKGTRYITRILKNLGESPLAP
jgi:acetylornithine deacetylase/succinyl-diaminopimelate desuccinylase-like protein